jgi:tetratricopeptide (TPR) repeat protein
MPKKSITTDEYIKRGHRYEEANDLDRAIDELNKALGDEKFTTQIKENLARVHYKRARAHQKKSHPDFGQIISDLETARLFNPSDLTFQQELARVHYKRGWAHQEKPLSDSTQAITDWETALQLDPNFMLEMGEDPVQINFMYGLVYTHQEDYTKAIEYDTKALEEGLKRVARWEEKINGTTVPNAKFALYTEKQKEGLRCAKIYENRGDCESDTLKKISDYSEALKLDPTLTNRLKPRILIHLITSGSDCYHKHDYAGALFFYEKALEGELQNPDLYLLIGQTHEANGDFSKAIAAYSQAAEKRPNHSRTYSNRASAYQKNGNLNEAIADVEMAMTLLNKSDSEKVKPLLASLYCTRGRANKEQSVPGLGHVVSDFKQAMLLDPIFGSEIALECSRAQIAYGEACYNEGDHRTAILSAIEALDADPSAIKAYDLLKTVLCTAQPGALDGFRADEMLSFIRRFPEERRVLLFKQCIEQPDTALGKRFHGDEMKALREKISSEIRETEPEWKPTFRFSQNAESNVGPQQDDDSKSHFPTHGF